MTERKNISMLHFTMLYPDIRQYTDTRKAANDAVSRLGGTNIKMEDKFSTTAFSFTYSHKHYVGIASRYTIKDERYMTVCAWPTIIDGFGTNVS